MADELTALEELVIAVSLGDPRSSLMPSSNYILWLFGHRARSLPLANPRLEALRRYAILSRTSKQALPQDECDRLVQAGYDASQKEAIDRLIAPYRLQHEFRVRDRSFARRRAENRTPGRLPPCPVPASGLSRSSSQQPSERKYAIYLPFSNLFYPHACDASVRNDA